MRKLMQNKDGWLRIVESVAGILIVAGVLLTMYVRNVQKGDISNYAISAEQKVLNDISLDTNLRREVLVNDLGSVSDYVNQSLPKDLGFEVRICDVDSACGMINMDNIKDTLNKEVFVQEKLVSSVIDSSGNAYFGPARVKLFVWQK